MCWRGCGRSGANEPRRHGGHGGVFVFGGVATWLVVGGGRGALHWLGLLGYSGVMRRPVIGLTMDGGEKPGKYGLNADYATSIEKAGGLPLGIPYRTDH